MIGKRFGIVWALLAVAAVTGCTTIPAKPYYASPVKDVGGGTWDYWRQVPPMAGTRFQPPEKSGCAVVEITIDSNGNVWDPKVLRFIGPAGFDTMVQRYLSSFHYRPATHNAEKIPVRTTFNLAYASHALRGGASISGMKASAVAEAASEQSCLADLQAQGIAPAAPGQE